MSFQRDDWCMPTSTVCHSRAVFTWAADARCHIERAIRAIPPMAEYEELLEALVQVSARLQHPEAHPAR